jgi:resuscitation-promoting factor RpfB
MQFLKTEDLRVVGTTLKSPADRRKRVIILQALKRIFATLQKIKAPRFLSRLSGTGRSLVSLAVTIMITMGSVATVMAATHTAHIICDGKQTDVEITSEKTDKILQKAGVTAGPQDIVIREDDPDHAGDLLFTVKKAVPIEISLSDSQQVLTAHYGDTVGEVLSSAGVNVDGDDEVTPPESTTLTGKSNITVTSRYHISVTADGKTTQAVVQSEPVSKVLSTVGVKLNPEDLVSVKPDAQVRDGMKIDVSRVTYRNVTQTEQIAYSNVTKKVTSLYAGTKKVDTKGKEGSKQTVVRQKLVNGKIAESETVQSTVVAQPVNQVTLVGIKSRTPGVASMSADGTVTDQNGKTLSYKRVLTGRCSAYTGGGWTSTGKKAAFGLVAVNPKIIPYGTKLYIASPDGRFVYGYATAADTGGAAMHGTILADLYYDTYSQCMKVGSRTMNVYVL